MPLRRHARQLSQSPVLWSWAFHGLRLASALILLPLVLRPEILGENDLGMYWVFAKLTSLAVLFDFGFSPSVGRNVSYAMAGAPHLKPDGMADTPPDGTPNFPLLWQLLDSTQRLFRQLSAGTFLVLGVVGTLTVASTVSQTASPTLTWTAWGLVLGSAVLEVYAGWWNSYLRGLNQVLPSARIATLAYGLRLVLAAILLMAGAGLMALPIAGLVSSYLHRTFSRRLCLQFLGSRPADLPATSLIAILWPNSWRTGLQFFSVYLATEANTLLCSHVLGLQVTAGYGLTAQVTQLVSSMAMVWCTVKWPLVGQYAKKRDVDGLRQLLRPRVWMLTLTFLFLASMAILLGPWMLKMLHTRRELLPLPLFLGMLGYSFMETQFAFWTTLLSLMRNRIPSLWPTVATNIVTLVAVLAGIQLAGPKPLGPEAETAWVLSVLSVFTFAPLAVGCLFNFWYWPRTGARELGTGWWRFMFQKT